VRDPNDVWMSAGSLCRKPAREPTTYILFVGGPLHRARSGADPPWSTLPHRDGEGPDHGSNAATDGRPFSVRGNAADFGNLSLQNASQPALVLLNPAAGSPPCRPSCRKNSFPAPKLTRSPLARPSAEASFDPSPRGRSAIRCGAAFENAWFALASDQPLPPSLSIAKFPFHRGGGGP
jgi:hypothetical protein